MVESQSTVVGVFEARQHADQAVKELQKAGIAKGRIEVARAVLGWESATIQAEQKNTVQERGFFKSVTVFFKKLLVNAKNTHLDSKQHGTGRTVVTVKAEGQADKVWLILRRHGAYNRANPAIAIVGAGPTA